MSAEGVRLPNAPAAVVPVVATALALEGGVDAAADFELEPPQAAAVPAASASTAVAARRCVVRM
jgi:hypothetical protein